MSNTAAAWPHFSGRLAFGCGLVLLAVALPYTLMAFTLSTPVHDYAGAISKYERALAVFPDSAAQAALATLRLAAARSTGAGLADAQRALEASLRTRPQDPLGWARLAYVYGEQGAPEKVGPALQRSFATGNYLPGFMQWRFLLGLRYWPQLDDAARAGVARQALLLWQTKPNDFIRLARMPALAAPIDSLMRTYHAAEVERFLQRRRPVRHTLPVARQP